MNIKKAMVYILMTTLLATVVLAGDFKIQNGTTGIDLMILDNEGNLNITTGQIAEGGTWLENLYCAISGGCVVTTMEVGTINVTGVLNATGATLVFDDDSIEEDDISFDTVCASGSRLYISGGDLACELADDTDTIWNITGGKYLYNDTTLIETGVLVVNETVLNATINNIVVTANDSMITYVDAQDIATNDSLITYIDAQDIVFNDSIVTYVDSVAGDNVTWNESLGNSLYVAVTGDTMTGDLIMNGGLLMDRIQLINASITGEDSSSNMTIDATGNIIFVLG